MKTITDGSSFQAVVFETKNGAWLDGDEVELLARVAWQREGCPPHRRRACRNEVELNS